MDKTSLTDAQIRTTRALPRRRILGFVSAAAAGAVAMPAEAQAADRDSGAWTDVGRCPRGAPGGRTGVTDADNGNWNDRPGFGRGAPYC